MASHINPLVSKGRHSKSHQAALSTGRRRIKRTSSPTYHIKRPSESTSKTKGQSLCAGFLSKPPPVLGEAEAEAHLIANPQCNALHFVVLELRRPRGFLSLEDLVCPCNAYTTSLHCALRPAPSPLPPPEYPATCSPLTCPGYPRLFVRTAPLQCRCSPACSLLPGRSALAGCQEWADL